MAELGKFFPTFQINLKQIKLNQQHRGQNRLSVGEQGSEINYCFNKSTAGKRITLCAREQMRFGF